VYFHHVHPDIRHYTSVTPRAFDHALGHLHEHFAALAPQAVPSVVEGAGHPEPTCLLTFDDGYVDVFEHALPIMEKRGWRALMFVSADLVGRVEHHPTRGPLHHMTWAQLEEVTRRGHVVASHARTHVPLNSLSPAAAQADIDGCRDILRERLPQARDWLAFPYGEPADPDAVRLPSLCFGSVKAPARAWDVAPREIRRTYLPADEPRRWQCCMTSWRQAWTPDASR
jgi:peptidoglycan/xylan/chitin deacetylase (PgdA/CDA1 family)